MEDELLPYYQRELSTFYLDAQEFARKHETVARQLMLESDGCGDPHVERLIQAFAFLSARVQRKIEDEFPEFTESLLGMLYPHYLRPVPPLSIARFTLKEPIEEVPYTVNTGTLVTSNRVPDLDVTCTFRTCYPVALWPLEVKSASFGHSSSVSRFHPIQAPYSIKIDLVYLGNSTQGLRIPSLRFFLNGEADPIHTLYELLFTKAVSICLLVPSGKVTKTITISADLIKAVGFGRDEALIPYPERSFEGYRLLQEYFSLPEKFLFFDFNGMDAVEFKNAGETISIVIGIESPERKEPLLQLERGVSAETFQLGCTPIANLFNRKAEPIRVTHMRAEYEVIPDIHRRAYTEVYSVNQVSSSAPFLAKGKEYAPLYSTVTRSNGEAEAFWHAVRRPSKKANDPGTEVYLSVVDKHLQIVSLREETLNIEVTCTNRDLASKLQTIGKGGELLTGSGSVAKARLLISPTKPIRPPSGKALHWRLISHLALNRLSIVKGGKDALKAILELYDLTQDPGVRRQIAGVTGVTSEAVISPRISENGIVFARGLAVQLELDEDDMLLGTRAFLFGAVLERFLGLYSAVNSFTQTTLRTRQRRDPVAKWDARCGEQIIL